MIYIITATPKNVTANATFYIYIRRLDDISMRASARDFLYHTITKFLHYNLTAVKLR